MNEQVKFYPFHAINEFMRADFRLNVIRDVLTNASTLPDTQTSELAHLTKRLIKIPGFRNSEKAPALVKVMPMAKGFEKYPELVVAILSSWASIHHELALQVYTLLKKRNWPIFEPENDVTLSSLSSDFIEKWPILPLDVNRNRAPGFMPRWPKGEDFETLYSAFVEHYPEKEASIDQVSLMTVWLTLRLPYTLEETDIPES